LIQSGENPKDTCDYVMIILIFPVEEIAAKIQKTRSNLPTVPQVVELGFEPNHL
jgi:hypothetical protein